MQLPAHRRANAYWQLDEMNDAEQPVDEDEEDGDDEAYREEAELIEREFLQTLDVTVGPARDANGKVIVFDRYGPILCGFCSHLLYLQRYLGRTIRVTRRTSRAARSGVSRARFTMWTMT